MAALKSQHRLNDILGAARAVVSQLDLDRALAVVLRKAMEVTRTKAGSIALYDHAANTLTIRAHKGFSKHFLGKETWTPRKGGLTDRILRTQDITVIPNTSRRRFFTNPTAVEEGIKSLISAPLRCQKETVGILYVDDFTPRKFTEMDLQELRILASFAAIAIRHAQMHEAVKQQAITDSLTGLFNRRCFEDILSRELQRADRHRREFSLALVDVDDFKRFNDKFGHQAGDAALAALGEAIRNSIRSTDLAARYGGDEMVIVLPETRLEKAYNLFAKRIKREIEEGFARLCRDRCRLTVTIGIASYPKDGTNGRELVLAADTALLNAKKRKDARMIGCARSVPLLDATP